MQKSKFFAIGFFLLILVSSLLAQTGAKYLVITHDNFIDVIKPLVDWKTKKGMPAVYVPLSVTGSTSSQIKTYILNAYNTWNPQPEYVLLVGNPDLLPSYYYSGGGYTDNYYGDLTGNYEMELCVGRFHCATLAQCSLMVAKSICYEKSETMHDSTWFIKGTTIIREDAPPDDYYQPNCRYIRNLWIYNGYIQTDSFISTQGDNQDSVINAINDGRAFVVFRGQAVSYWWPPFNVNPNNTANDYKLPIVVSGTCATMTLAPGENMLGDAFVRAGTIQNPKGAVGFFGTTFVGSYISQPRGLVTTGFFHALYEDSVLTMGGAAKRGKFIMDSILPNQTRYVEWNLLGDPELNVWTKQPQELTVTYDSTIFVEPTNYQVEVEDSVGQPVNHALICIMMDSTVYVYGYTDSTGGMTFSLIPLHSGILQITVTAHNYFPYEGTANVIINRDVGVTQIVRPIATIDSTGPIMPQVRAKNFGSIPETFNITFKIDTIYFQNRQKTLNAGMEDTANFPLWTPTRGTFTICCSTYLAGDINSYNDTLSGSCTIQVKDMGVTQIITPTGLIDSGTVVEPQARVKNYGTNQVLFPVILRVGMFYADTQNVNLNSGDSALVSFDSCALLLRGTQPVKCSTALNGDGNSTNNAMRDSVTIMVSLTDVGVTQIITPTGNLTPGTIITPTARIANYSLSPQTFPVFFRIVSLTDTIYSDDTLITLEAEQDSVIRFDDWTSIAGSFRSFTRTALVGDENPLNDTASNNFTVTSGGGSTNWQRLADVPSTPSGKTPKNGTSIVGLAGKVYLLKANNTPDFYSFTPDASLGNWSILTAMPLGTKETGDGKNPKKGASLAAYNDNIYVLRGNNKSGFWRYSATGNSWQKMKDIPTGAKNPKDGSGMVYVQKDTNDYIFTMKGSKTSEFYLYSINDDNWQSVASPSVGTSGKLGYKNGSCLAYDEDSLVYVMKGNYGDFFRYNVLSNTWTELKRYDSKLFINREGKKKKVKDGAGLSYLNGAVYLMKGGKTNEFWKYDIGANNWFQMNPSNLWDIPGGIKVKSGGALCIMDNTFYAAKGNKTSEFYWHGAPTSVLAKEPTPKYTEGMMENKTKIDNFVISISPNPAGNVIAVKYHLPVAASLNVKLYRVSGELIKSFTATKREKNGSVLIDTRELACGIYMLRFDTPNLTITRKLIIEK